MPRKVSRKSQKAKADKLCRQIVFERDQECISGRPRHAGSLQWAHIISRRYLMIRADPQNSVVLCAGCHVFFTHRPVEWNDWVESKFPGRLDYLKSLIRKGYKPDYETVISELEKQWADISSVPLLQRKSSLSTSQKDTPNNG